MTSSFIVSSRIKKIELSTIANTFVVKPKSSSNPSQSRKTREELYLKLKTINILNIIIVTNTLITFFQ